MITVVIPTHNDADQLYDTIESCLLTALISEVIVVDDCSDGNNPRTVFDACFGKDISVRLFTNSINYGLAGSRNKGIDNATNDWIIPLDTGDWFYKGGVYGLWLEANKDGFQHDVYYGNITHKHDTSHPKHHIAKPAPEVTEEGFRSPVNPLFCSSLFSKEIWKKANGYTMRPHSFYEDMDFFCKVLSVGGKFKYCDVLVYHHDDPGGSMLSELHEHTEEYKEMSRIGLEYGNNKKCYKPLW